MYWPGTTTSPGRAARAPARSASATSGSGTGWRAPASAITAKAATASRVAVKPQLNRRLRTRLAYLRGLAQRASGVEPPAGERCAGERALAVGAAQDRGLDLGRREPRSRREHEARHAGRVRGRHRGPAGGREAPARLGAQDQGARGGEVDARAAEAREARQAIARSARRHAEDVGQRVAARVLGARGLVVVVTPV